MKQSLQIDKSEAKVREKWDPRKKDSVIKKDTENGWKNKMNSLKKEKEKQKERVPVKFEPRRPVKLLQRQEYASATYLVKYLEDQEIVDIVKDNLTIG